MKKYIASSLETHLFFGRIMKEHALFLQAAFPAGETGYSSTADRCRSEFEKVLWQTVRLMGGLRKLRGYLSGQGEGSRDEAVRRSGKGKRKLGLRYQAS